jgi:hypothetical protein
MTTRAKTSSSHITDTSSVGERACRVSLQISLGHLGRVRVRSECRARTDLSLTGRDRADVQVR